MRLESTLDTKGYMYNTYMYVVFICPWRIPCHLHVVTCSLVIRYQFVVA